ncbi:sulfotransferase family 2 domain-containing protein [Shimia haliotis]|uniref:Sulfotransferase family protein n=1 Tax=Shimia haliotis TaxID=1280847 RepID=A0A1I4EHV6_9RHOB|nr:sulfotransferase family 2 domain-containing protein [Shimia haliotis]SFL05334.1 Sulfotransferase family protein [Shimia haliotis]
MRTYDPDQPLIFSHIPKTGGSSVKRVFAGWFGDNYLLHRKRKGIWLKQDLANLPDPTAPAVVCGHFNRMRGSSLEAFYPEVQQLVTVLRNPWERVVSGYFYRQRVLANPRHPNSPAFQRVVALSLDDYVSGWPYDDPDFGPPMTNFLPKPAAGQTIIDAMEEHCVAVGILELLPKSLSVIATALGRPTPPSTPHQNATPRNAGLPTHLKAAFVERNAQEYEIYNHFRHRLLSEAPGEPLQ